MHAPDKRGFTLIEVMVVMLLISVLVVVISALFFRGRDALRLSTEKVETAGDTRRAYDALAPLALASVRADGSGAMSVHDSTPLLLTDPCYLDLTTRENFLSTAYSPRTEYRPLTAGPALRFRVSFDPVKRHLLLSQLEQNSDQIDDTVTPRVLASEITGCSFRRLSVGSVAVTLESRSAREDERRPGGSTSTTLHAVLTAPGS